MADRFQGGDLENGGVSTTQERTRSSSISYLCAHGAIREYLSVKLNPVRF